MPRINPSAIPLIVLTQSLLVLHAARPEVLRAQPAPPPEVRIPRLEGNPTVDGRLDEPQWSHALLLEDYLMYEPSEDLPLPGRTRARLYFTQDAIHFGFDCQLERPEELRAHLAPREDIDTDDQIGIYLDTFNDDRQAFVFYVNALGVQQDVRYVEESTWNQSWDTVFQSVGQKTAQGFTVEVSIPFRSLRFPSVESQRWGLMLTRKFAASGTKAAWPRLSRNQISRLAQAGTLSGIEGVVSNQNIEVQPTLVTELGEAANLSEERLRPPLTLQLGEQGENATGSGMSVAPGLNLKYGVTSDLTLDATLNPDFSQVEADPYQLTLNRRQALYFEERRPFFLEGAETLSGAPYLSLYTRSIVSPLYGIKLTGRQGKTSIGLLHALDTAPQPSLTLSFQPNLLSPDTPGFTTSDLVPDDGTPRHALVSVARVSRDLDNSNVVGLTLIDKEIVDPVNRHAYGFHRFGSADLQWQASPRDRFVASTELSWTGLRDDESLLDFGYFLAYSRTTRKVEVFATHGYEGPDFRAEASFLPYVGVLFSDVFARYRIEPGVPQVLYVQPQIYAKQFVEPTTRSVVEQGLSPSILTRFAHQTTLFVGTNLSEERYFDVAYPIRRLNLEFSSEALSGLHLYFGHYEGGGLDYNLIFGSEESPSLADVQLYDVSSYLTLRVRPSPELQLDAEYRHYLSLEEGAPSPVLLARAIGGEPLPVAYAQGVFLGRLNLSLTRSWSVRAVARLSDGRSNGTGEAKLDGGALLTWLPHPGTAAYLGVSGGCGQEWEDLESRPTWQTSCVDTDQATWRVFMKLSYLWRV